MDDNIYQSPESELIENEEHHFAGFWIRVGASIIDSIFMILITFPFLSLIYGADYWMSEMFVMGIWDFLISYVFPMIAVILFWLYKSATPGKMIVGIEVISLGYTRKLSIGQSVGRYFAYFPSMIVLFLGFIWVAFDKRKQGWHDKLSNTAVVRKRV